MRAVVLRSHGGPEVLTIEEVDDPVPGPDDILVDVSTTALNRADTLQRMGMYPDPRSREIEIPGLEYSGVVAGVGSEVTGWSIGPRSAEGDAPEYDGSGDAADLYDKLEKTILPLYYGDRVGWTRVMKNAIGKNAYYFNTHRMMRRYVTNAYIRTQEPSLPDGE